MNHARLTASQEKKDKKPDAFPKEPLVDRMGPEDIQRALFNEYEMGSVQPVRQRAYADIPIENYDFHLF